jgi:hypothetical protein
MFAIARAISGATALNKVHNGSVVGVIDVDGLLGSISCSTDVSELASWAGRSLETFEEQGNDLTVVLPQVALADNGREVAKVLRDRLIRLLLAIGQAEETRGGFGTNMLLKGCPALGHRLLVGAQTGGRTAKVLAKDAELLIWRQLVEIHECIEVAAKVFIAHLFGVVDGRFGLEGRIAARRARTLVARRRARRGRRAITMLVMSVSERRCGVVAIVTRARARARRRA